MRRYLNMDLLKAGTSCRSMNKLALVHQRDGRHPYLRHRRSPDLRASDGGSGGTALDLPASVSASGTSQSSDRGAPTLKSERLWTQPRHTPTNYLCL
jgi:hypothetical protein